MSNDGFADVNASVGLIAKGVVDMAKAQVSSKLKPTRSKAKVSPKLKPTRSKDWVTLSSKYQVVIPKAVRERAGLEPGQKFLVMLDGETIRLVPQVPLESLLGIAKGANTEGLREKVDRM